MTKFFFFKYKNLTKHSLEYFIRPREQAEDIPWGERNVKEETKFAAEVQLLSTLQREE